MQVPIADVVLEYRNHLDAITSELMNFRAAVKALEKENETLTAKVKELDGKSENPPETPPTKL